MMQRLWVQLKIIYAFTAFPCYAFERQMNEVLSFVNFKEEQEIIKRSFLAIVS